MYRLTACFALALLAVSSLAPAAEIEGTKSPTAKSNTQSETQSETKKADAKDSKPAKATNNKKAAEAEDKVFIPSEEISEDFAVSFPVDI